MTRTILLAVLLLAAAAQPLRAQVSADPERCSPQEPNFCLNGVSNAVTALDSLRVSAVSPRGEREEEDKKKKRAGAGTIVLAASEKIAGLGAADPWAVWLSYGRAKFAGSVAVAPYSAELDTVRIGVDRLFAGRYSLGLALLAERLDTRTKYNGGGQNVDGTTFVPYLTVLLSDSFSLDLNAGFGRSDASQNRIDPASAPGAPLTLSANYSAKRDFYSATLNGFRPIGNWTLGGRLGYLYSEEDQTGFRETGGPSARNVLGRTVKLGQLFAGLDAAYRFANNVEPNAALVFRRDTSRDDGRAGGGLPAAVGATQPDDRTEWEWSLGVRYFGRRGLTLSAEYLKTEGRDRFRNESLNFLARFEF